MDYLSSPWRYGYVTQENRPSECFLCDLAALDGSEDKKHVVLHRARHNLVVLNRFPYNPGHVLVAPYAHVAELTDADPEGLREMMNLARKIQSALKECYQPAGYNLGLNIGRCAGAGVDRHLHLHVLPRWTGDTNFITVVGETRVLPEDLESTYEKLAPFFRC